MPATARWRTIRSKTWFCARVTAANSSTKKVISHSVYVALIDLTVMVGAGVATISRQFRMAWASISVPIAGAVWAASCTVIVAPWMPAGKLTLTIFDLAIVLFGTIARS